MGGPVVRLPLALAVAVLVTRARGQGFGVCTRPAAADVPAYDLSSLHEVSLSISTFDVTGVACRYGFEATRTQNGSAARPSATACLIPGTPYTLAGCGELCDAVCRGAPGRCYHEWRGDGVCDDACNVEACGYDGTAGKVPDCDQCMRQPTKRTGEVCLPATCPRSRTAAVSGSETPCTCAKGFYGAAVGSHSSPVWGAIDGPSVGFTERQLHRTKPSDVEDPAWRMKHGLPSCAPCPVPNAQFRGVCPGGPSFLAEDSLGDATRDYSAKLLPEPGYWIPDLLVRDVVLGLDQVSVVSSPGTRIRDQGRRSDRGGYTRLCAEENADEICVGTTLERDWVSQGDTYQYAGMCGGYVKTLVHGPFQEDAIFRFDRDENGFITKDEFVEACTRLEEHEKHENSTAIPGDCSRFPKPGAEQLGLDDFTKWWLGPDTNAERLRNIYTDKTLGDTDVTLLDGVKKHFQTCVQLGAELGEDVLNELRCVQPPNFCRANHTGLYCQECANGTKLLDDGTCCEEKGDEEKVVWKSLVDVMTTPLLYAIYFIHRSRDVQAADSILTTIIFHLQTLSLFTGVNVDSQLTNHLDMGFVSSEALGSTLSTVLNFVNLNGEVYNQLYQLNELNVADLAMNLQQTAKNPCAVNFCPLLTEAPAVSEFKSTCGLGGNGRVSIYWAYLEATAVPGEPGGTEGGCYVAIFWSYLSMPAITIVYMCIFLRLRSKLHDHRSCLFKGVSDSGVRRTGLSRFAYWITRRTFCRPFTTEEYDLYLAEQDLIKRRASWCRGEHLKCCCSLGQCCCFSEDHQAGRRHVTCCKALSWAGVIPFGLPWLPAELHRCAVSMYIYQFLPQLQLLQGHILWRKVDITEQTDLNVDGSEQYQYTVLADSELEWGSAEHLPTLLASMSLLFVHFMLIGYLLQGVQQETLWHKRTTTGISKSATQIFKMYGETKLFLQNSEDAKRADQKNIDLLKNVPKLQSMDDETLRLIEAASKTTSYAYGETVTTLEEAANVLYIVETGILCSSTENESHLPDQIFKRGDYFGSAMLSDTTMVDAAAIKVSTTDATCLQIDCKQLENDGILQAITDASQEVAELTEADGTASRRRRSRMNSFQDASMTNRGKWQWAQQKGGKRLTVSARNYLEVRGMAEESEIVEKKSGGQEIKRLKAGRVTDDGDVRTFVVGQETLRFSPVYGVYRPGTCRTKFIWCGQAVCDEGDIGQADTDRESPTTLRNQQKDKCRCSVENGSGYAWWFVVDILRKIALVVATTSRTDSRNVATFFCLCASVAGYLWANPFPDPAANLFEACSSFLLLYHLYAMQISGSPDGTSAEPFSPSPYLLTTYFLLGGVGLMLARTRFGGAWSVYLEFKLRNCCRRAVYKYEVLAGDKAAYSEQTLRLAESAFHETQEKLQSMLLEYHSVQLRAENAREIAALEEEFTIAKHRYDLEIALMHKRNREEQLRKLATRESLRSAIRKVRFETRTIGIINSGVQQSQDEDYAHRVVFIKGLHQLDGFNYDADLRTIFSQYGTVTQVLVRRRIRKVETDYGSWGLVTFADASMASKAVEAPVEVQTKAGIKVVLPTKRFDPEKARASKGGMKQIAFGEYGKHGVEPWYAWIKRNFCCCGGGEEGTARSARSSSRVWDAMHGSSAAVTVKRFRKRYDTQTSAPEESIEAIPDGEEEDEDEDDEDDSVRPDEESSAGCCCCCLVLLFVALLTTDLMQLKLEEYEPDVVQLALDIGPPGGQ